jgi:O-antigen/teichoic acid export membrane protein
VKAKVRELIANKDVSELVKRSSVSLSIRLIGTLFTYLLALLLIKEYGIAAWGSFMLLFTVFQISLLVARLGIDKNFMISASKNFRGQSDINTHSLFVKSTKTLIISGTLSALLLWSLSSFLSQTLFHSQEYSSSIQLIAISLIPAALLMLNAEGLRAIKQNAWYSFFEKGGFFTFTFLGIIISLFLFSYSIIPVQSFVISVFVLSIFSFIIWNNKSRNVISTEGTEMSSKQIITSSLPLLLSGSGFMLMSWIDVIVLGIVDSQESVGTFNVAARIASVNSIILVAINTVNGPKIASFFAKKEFNRLHQYVKHSNLITGALALPLLVLIFTFPAFLIGIFDKAIYSETLVYSLFILAIGEFVNALCGSVGLILQTTNNQKAFQNIVLVSAAINILLSIILIPSLGILGAAISNAVSTLTWNIASVVIIKKRLGFMVLPSILRTK